MKRLYHFLLDERDPDLIDIIKKMLNHEISYFEFIRLYFSLMLLFELSLIGTIIPIAIIIVLFTDTPIGFIPVPWIFVSLIVSLITTNILKPRFIHIDKHPD